jgi:transcriptional regulator with XRE-family HTH domain
MATELRGHALFRKWADGTGMTEIQLAGLLQTTQATISRWYKGSSAPGRAFQRTLKLVCDIPYDAWVEEVPKPVTARRRHSTPTMPAANDVPAPQRVSRRKNTGGV